MFFDNIELKKTQSKFRNYAINIKEDLLNQIISNKSNSRIYFETKYDELLYKYLDTINPFNYNKICSKFVHDIYQFVPAADTM
ncbi:MAG: hypothetical protein PHD15_04110 [Clostridia bacterium]|nr:hypothetical protein [Clostridia bacterium]MDD4386924.1 hypothetical protein [Clostridia bacterium]